MVALAAAEDWSRELEGLAARLGRRFGRAEPRGEALAYLRGLLSPLERKNGWQLAEAAGQASPGRVQDFLARTRWNAEAVRDDLRAYVVEQLGDPSAVLVLDETGFLKKGAHSAGVQRQYSGTAGRIENCQIGVFLGYASRHGRALIDRALYLPQGWAADAARRARAGVPAATSFATKPELGLAMLQRAFTAGVPCAWVSGDSVYGADSRLRRGIEARPCGYVLAVTSGQRLGLVPVEEWLAEIPPGGWQRLSAGEGAKGPRLYDWAWLPCRGAGPGWQKGLLIRRSTARPEGFTYYLTLAPAAATLADLVRVAGTRWTIESCFEEAKGEVGLDHYEVRSWTGWHRHITLAMLAHAYLAVLRQGAVGGRGQPRSRGRPAAPHRARGAAPALASRLGPSIQAGRRAPLVHLATTPSAACAPSPLAQTDTPQAQLVVATPA
ncbi:IS701 family transposase [Siccirubricoccus sp. G192]|uniref:IS701 family transposase n=1 Tax=Siccirubricoccus sp. G192 TaxID=2849651 RepID=UPI0020C4C6E8|nr:IS701 family transposase [Siccirubricoccus sp. G192]